MSATPLDRAMLRAQEIILNNTGKHVGAQTALATVLDVTPQAVSQWAKAGYAPNDRAIQIEVMTGVSRRELIDPALIELVGSTT